MSGSPARRPGAGTLAYRILTAHNTSGDPLNLKLRVDSLASHDITYVGIIQTARAGGLKEFPVPYVLTNCHNSLCAVGGTINEDDHVFGLSAARKYGGIYVPAHQAVIHQYVRETMAGCGRMIMASDSHTRYGALGTMGFGEGGPELVKQLLGRTYDLAYPEVVAVYLDGRPAPGVGPQDVALAIIRAVFAKGIREEQGHGVHRAGGSRSPDGLPERDRRHDHRDDLPLLDLADGRSRWRRWYRIHGRPEDYRPMEPDDVAWYDGIIEVDLGKVEPMIALPFHPSNVWPIAELNRNALEILREVEAEGNKQMENPNLQFRLTDKLVGGRLKADQGVVVGLRRRHLRQHRRDGGNPGREDPSATASFSLSVYPASQPIFLELIRNRSIEKLMAAGAVIRTAFCGPCFGAGDTPANNALCVRHTTRNFPNREGSIPAQGQLASVALMDARSIAATAMNGGIVTPATEVDVPAVQAGYTPSINRSTTTGSTRASGTPIPKRTLRFGPNIADWPKMEPLPENLLLRVASVIRDPVTTTDELIPSGETASYRSNPLKLAEFTLSRKDPGYVARAKAVQKLESRRLALLAEGGADG